MIKSLSRTDKWLVAVLVVSGMVAAGAAWRSYVNVVPVVNIPPYPVLPNPNGYDLFVQAGQSIVKVNPAVDETLDGAPTDDAKIRAQRYSLARKETFLQQNQKAFMLLQKGLKTPTLQPPMRFAVPPTLPENKILRELARCRAVEAKTFALKGEWGKATQSRLDTVQMGNMVGHGGPIVPGLVSIAIQAIGRNDWWNDVNHLNAKECRMAIDRLEAIYAKRLRADATFTEEKYCGQVMYLGVMRGPSWAFFWVPKRTAMNNYIQMMDAHIANTRKPYLKRTPVPLPDDPLTRILAPVFDRAHWNFARNDAGNALWLISLALRVYRLENGKYPEQLKELAPRYLKQIPTDPFGGGENMRYKKIKNTYVLYSIGSDGVDNGGKPIPPRRFLRRTGASSQNGKLPIVDFNSKGDYVAGKNR